MAMQQGTKVELSEIDASHEKRKKRGYRWLVESRINGKRGRKYFKHGAKAEAKEHKDELERRLTKVSESNRALLNEDLLTEATEGAKKLAKHGKTLSDAVKFYLAHLKKLEVQDSTSLNDAIGLFLDAKIAKGIKDDTVKRYRETLNRFLLTFPNRTVASFEGVEIERWWETFGTVANQRANRTDVNVFFNWIVDSTKFENIKTNPVPAPPELNKRTKLAKRRIILSPVEVKRLLKACDAEILPLMVAQIFIGVRPEESLRLTWGHFDFEAEQLNISADIAKGGDKHARINKIPANAMKWLQPYLLKTEGRLLPKVESKSAFDDRLRKLREKAGWPAGTWPQNALRKTFISCHYASYSKVSKTASIAGTSEAIIFSNYRAVVTKTKAKKLWKVEPPKNGKIVQMVKAG